MAITMLLLAAFTVAPPEWTAAEAAFSAIHDVSAVYESVGVNPDAPKWPHEQTGTLRFVAGEVYSIERFNESDGFPSVQVWTKTPNALPKYVNRGLNPKKAPNDQAIDRRFTPSSFIDSPTQFFPWPYYLQFTRELRESIKYVGEEAINDLNCLKFEYKNGSTLTVVWICLERGGHIIKQQKWIALESNLLSQECLTTHFREIPDAKRKKHWFPVEFKLSHYYDAEKRVSNRTPNYVVDFLFVPAKVKINTGLTLKDVEIQFDPRVNIDGLKPETPSPPRPPNTRDVETRSVGTFADVRKTLAEADAQKAELDARRSAPPPGDAWPWVWIGSVVAVLFGSAALYFKLRPGS